MAKTQLSFLNLSELKGCLSSKIQNRSSSSHSGFNQDLIPSYSSFWVDQIINNDLWNPIKQPTLVNSFIKALFEDEIKCAEAYQDERGIDWKGYVEAKATAGFGKTKEWEFFDSREVFVQVDSQWLKPKTSEDEMLWTKRVEDVLLHGRKVDVQIITANGLQLNSISKGNLDEMVKTNDVAREWAQEILKPYESLGHGVHFQAGLESQKYEMIASVNQELDLEIKFFTVLWTEHHFLFLILHEMRNFI